MQYESCSPLCPALQGLAPSCTILHPCPDPSLPCAGGAKAQMPAQLPCSSCSFPTAVQREGHQRATLFLFYLTRSSLGKLTDVRSMSPCLLILRCLPQEEVLQGHSLPSWPDQCIWGTQDHLKGWEEGHLQSH